MQLPPPLRAAIERELEGIPLRELSQAADTLSQRYRAEVLDGRLHIGDALAARAYLTTRLPATFAAVSAALAAVVEACPDFAPQTLLDAGAGPGTATWASAEHWPGLRDALLLEASEPIRAVGERLSSSLELERVTWAAAKLDDNLGNLAPRDLVILGYVLDELPPAARPPLIERLWRVTAETLVIVEPGTTQGWKRILQARNLLIGAGGHILAPCPHNHPCPLVAPDWCHFSARVPRSRLHREAKGGTVPWEDEKFIYLAASRHPAQDKLPRIIAPERSQKSGVALTLCEPDGTVAQRQFSKRDRGPFQAVRRLRWGDRFPKI